MKAYSYYAYGSPDVLKLEEVEIPKPNANELLIRTKALSINPSELHKLTASFWLLRLSIGLLKPKTPILGADIAGEIVCVGDSKGQFKVGDRVFGRNLFGCLAEYCCIDESKIALIPDNMFYEDAAALPLASVTALIALRDKGQVKANQKVLIHGASGGIGTFAIQLAKHYKCNVTGVCSSNNVDLVKSLGADEVIDYKKQDLKSLDLQFDLILDLVGNRKITTLIKLLKQNGKCILVGMDTPKRLFGNMFQGLILSAFGSKKILAMDALVSTEDLAFVSKLVAKGEIRLVIDKIYDFKSLPMAFRHLGTKRSRGKVVINL